MFAHPTLPFPDRRRFPIALHVSSFSTVAVCCVAVLPPLLDPMVESWIVAPPRWWVARSSRIA